MDKIGIKVSYWEGIPKIYIKSRPLHFIDYLKEITLQKNL